MKARRQRLIKSGLQLRLIAVFLGLAAISGALQVILINRSILSLARHNVVRDDALLKALPDILTSNLLLTLGFLVPLMGYVGLLLTQRIAGPIYRYERYLDSVVAGEHRGPCKIRKGDELQDLCDRINRVTAELDRARAAAGAQGQKAA
jgi:signal transduction histidine kinase